MPRTDDYKNAAELSKSALRKKDPKRVAEDSGARWEPDREGKGSLSLEFLGRRVDILWPDVEPTYEGAEEVPIQQQVLLLHYLDGASGLVPTGEWIAYQDVPDGKFYLDAFLRRAKVPMVQAFGGTPERLAELAQQLYGTTPFAQGDVGVVVRALPKVPVALILWKGDDEFPPEGNLLFDRSISRILSAEDIAWLAGMIVYPLIGMLRKK